MENIVKMMELSTAHITEKTSQDLTHNFINITSSCFENGWILYADTDACDHDEDFPEDLKKVIEYAAAQGCGWILLDSEVEPIKDLPTYEWEN